MMSGKTGGNALLKLTFCLRRLPALSHAEFCDYWLNKHGPLVRRLQPALGMARYVQVHRLDDVLEENAIEFEHEPDDAEDMVEQFKAFLDEVAPEDFAEGS